MPRIKKKSPKIGSVVSNEIIDAICDITIFTFQSPKIGSVVSNTLAKRLILELLLASCFNPLKSGQLFQIRRMDDDCPEPWTDKFQSPKIGSVVSNVSHKEYAEMI